MPGLQHRNQGIPGFTKKILQDSINQKEITMVDTNLFKKHNVRGAVTYSNFTMERALASNAKSQFKKDDESKVAPDFQLLLDQVQLDKIIAHIQDVYLPEAIRRHAAGEKRDAFDKKQADKIAKALDEGVAENWENAPPYLPVKKVYEKTLEVAPWAVATLKATGSQGRDIEQLARVNSEDELKVPDPNLLSFPTLKPIDQTVHELYPGAWAYATLNLSGYFQSAGNYGISAYANTIVFLEDRDRLAGGASLDTDDIFLDD